MVWGNEDGYQGSRCSLLISSLLISQSVHAIFEVRAPLAELEHQSGPENCSDWTAGLVEGGTAVKELH